MQRQLRGGNSVTQLGILLLVLGIGVRLALWLGIILSPLTFWAIGIGLVLIVIGSLRGDR